MLLALQGFETVNSVMHKISTDSYIDSKRKWSYKLLKIFLFSHSLRQVKRIIRQKGLRRRQHSSDIGEVLDAVQVSKHFLFTQPCLQLVTNFHFIAFHIPERKN